jgi:allantoinase
MASFNRQPTMTRPLLPKHNRYDYVPLPERKDYDWPGGKRLAFVMTTNIECYAFGAGLGHDPAKVGEPQTHRNYSWRDYGNRIGIWRLLDLFDELQMPAAHNTNSLVYDYFPQIMDAVRKRGDEVVGHGRTNAENHRGLWEADEERILQEVIAKVVEHEGKPPEGWMGSGAYETSNTPDLLKEAGFKYLMDWPMDDQPIWMRTRSGPILSVPYPVELNDAQIITHRKQDAAEFCDAMVNQFDEMMEQCRTHPLVMNISIHPNIFGQPFRLRLLRSALQHCLGGANRSKLWLARPREISDFCYGMAPGIIPGS